MVFSIFARRFRLLLCLSVLMLLANDGIAHSLSVFAWVDGKIVQVESKFHGGKRPKESNVTVFRGDGSLLVQGETDSEGRFQFEPEGPDEYHIIIYAGLGHQGEWRMTREDFRDDFLTTDLSLTNATSTIKSTKKPNEAIAIPDNVSQGELERMIETAVERAMARQSVNINKARNLRIDQSFGLRDILGGIGYIIGLVGLGAYISYRKKR